MSRSISPGQRWLPKLEPGFQHPRTLNIGNKNQYLIPHLSAIPFADHSINGSSIVGHQANFNFFSCAPAPATKVNTSIPTNRIKMNDFFINFPPPIFCLRLVYKKIIGFLDWESLITSSYFFISFQFILS